jgi:hypothetical protein
MSGRDSGRRRPSLIGGAVLTVATVAICLLVAEAISRLWDPEASLWHWRFHFADTSDPTPGTAQFAYDPTLGWIPIAGSSGTMLGKPLTFTAGGTRAHNTEVPRPTGPLILALGDSMTEGYAVGDDETWPAAL